MKQLGNGVSAVESNSKESETACALSDLLGEPVELGRFEGGTIVDWDELQAQRDNDFCRAIIELSTG